MPADAKSALEAVLALADRWAAEPSKVYQHCARKIREAVASNTAIPNRQED